MIFMVIVGMVCLMLGYAYSTRNDFSPQLAGFAVNRKSKNNSYRARATRAFGKFLKWCNYHAFRDVDPSAKGAAIMRGMNFLRGRLGNTGFRQQYVNDGNGSYKRETVAFTMPTGNSSNTVLQSAQRSRFRLLTILGSALSRCGILRQWYYSGIGISGYNAFMRDNLRNEAVVTHSNGEQFIDWTKVLVAIGSGFQKILPFKSGLVPGTDYDPSCESVVQLRWGTQCVCKSPEDRDNYALILVGVKVNQDGTLEDVCYKQPGATLANCSIEVKLPICDCCKTYWFAFFANPYNGDNTHSVYLGPDTNFGNLPMHDPATCCFKCEEEEAVDETVTAPDEIPVFCGCGHDDHDPVDREAIIFNGEKNFGVGYGITPVNLLDAGTNDGSGYEAPADDDVSMINEVVYTIGDGTCPIDWASTLLDLTMVGLTNKESFIDGDELAAVFTAEFGNGTFTYDSDTCTLLSTDSTDVGGVIPFGENNIIVASGSDFSLMQGYGQANNGTQTTRLMVNNITGGETSVSIELDVDGYTGTIDASNVLPAPNIQVDSVTQVGSVFTITVSTIDGNPLTFGPIYSLVADNVDGSGTWTATLSNPSSDADAANNSSSAVSG